MGLFAHLCVAMVFGGTLLEEAEIPRAVYGTMGQHGQPRPTTTHAATHVAQCIDKQKTSRK